MSLESSLNRVRAWRLALWAAVIAFVVMFLPPTLHTLHLRRIIADFESKRPAYERAVRWALANEGPVPKELARGVGQDRIVVIGQAGQRVVYFDLEDLGETVRKIAYVEPANVDLEKLESEWADWTERRIDEHWQIVQVLP